MVNHIEHNPVRVSSAAEGHDCWAAGLPCLLSGRPRRPPPPRTSRLMRTQGVLPVVVGVLRGALLAGALAAVGALTTALTALDAGDVALWAPVAVAALRAAEAWLLDRRQPPQQAPLGGGPA